MYIYCCQCRKDVKATLTTGSEVYPRRRDLSLLPFWICKCGCFVGCHHKTRDPTKPLGCIPSAEIKRARKHLHAIIDPLWSGYKKKRNARVRVYKAISDFCGYEFHCAEVRDIEEARRIYKFIKGLR